MIPAPEVMIWRRGMAIPTDVPAGRYTIIYRVFGPLELPAWIAAKRMVGKAMNCAGTTRAEVRGFKMIKRLFSPNVDFFFDVDIQGGAPILVLAAIAAIAASLGAIAIFTNATAVEIRKVLTTPAGQETLKGIGGNIGGAVAIGGLALILLAVGGVIIYAATKKR